LCPCGRCLAFTAPAFWWLGRVGVSQLPCRATTPPLSCRASTPRLPPKLRESRRTLSTFFPENSSGAGWVLEFSEPFTPIYSRVICVLKLSASHLGVCSACIFMLLTAFSKGPTVEINRKVSAPPLNFPIRRNGDSSTWEGLPGEPMRAFLSKLKLWDKTLGTPPRHFAGPLVLEAHFSSLMSE